MNTKKYNRTSDWIVVRWMLILRPAILTAILGMAIFKLPGEEIARNNIIIVVLGTYLLTILYWFSHTFFGTSRPLLAIQISFDIFLITVIIFVINRSTEGYDSTFIGLYFLSIMCSSLFFKRFVTFLFTLQSILFFVSSLLIINIFIDPFFIPEVMRNSIILQTFMFCLLMLVVGFFSSYYAEMVVRKDSALTSALRLLKKARLDTSDILQSMTNGLITIDTSGVIMYMNRAAKSILEIDDTLVDWKDCKSVLEKRSPEFVNVLESGISGRYLSSEIGIEILNNKGETVPIGLTMMTLYDTDGSSRGLIVNFKDLTEKNKLLEMVRQSDRMAAIGELSASIAHELKNPLASICSAVEILADNINFEAPHSAKLVEIIEKESSRLERISTDFLKFARITTPDIKPVVLSTMIDEVVALIENDPRKTGNIVIINSIDTEIIVMFDDDQLRQVLINLLINSLEVLKGNGEIKLVLQRDEIYARKYVRLLVMDNGPGFPGEALGKMFEPFYSTKKNGTGLGLAIVRKIVVSNNGRVFAQNRMNGGAEVALDIVVEER